MTLKDLSHAADIAVPILCVWITFWPFIGFVMIEHFWPRLSGEPAMRISRGMFIGGLSMLLLTMLIPSTPY